MLCIFLLKQYFFIYMYLHILLHMLLNTCVKNKIVTNCKILCKLDEEKRHSIVDDWAPTKSRHQI